MIRIRVQVEEMHVYYFIAKKLIGGAKLGFMGIMTGAEERLINDIYHSDDLNEINDFSKKLFDKLDKEQTELKLNTNPVGFKDIDELISEAISYTPNLMFKREVLDNVKKTLKNELTTHEKVILCVDRISQAKRVLSGLSPKERKDILDGKGFEIKKVGNDKINNDIHAVDEENVMNGYEVLGAGSSLESVSCEKADIKENDDTEEIEVLDIDYEDKEKSHEEVIVENKQDIVHEVVDSCVNDEDESLNNNSVSFEDDDSTDKDLNEKTHVMLPLNVVEPSPLSERVRTNDIGFSEPPMVYPADDSDTIQINDVLCKDVVSNEIIVDNCEENYAVPEIFKIIERDGVEVDEEIIKD